jgi:proline iminopeptidase
MRSSRYLSKSMALALLASASAIYVQAQQLSHPPGQFLTIMGAKIWVEEEGSGDPLLLIAGAGGSHDYFHPYFSQLAAAHRVIYYDAFGRGNSDRGKSPSDYSLARDVEEVEALRQALHIRKMSIYGHSYGGFVAEGYAAKYPGHLSHLILSDTFISGADFQESNEHINAEIRQYLPELWDNVAALRAKGLLASSPELQQAYLGYIGKMLELFYVYNPERAKDIPWNDHNFNPDVWYGTVGKDADFRVGSPLAESDYSAALNAMKAPLLVMVGRKDGVILPRLARHFVTAVPKTQFIIFEKSGHYPFMEETSGCMAAIDRFLGQNKS